MKTQILMLVVISSMLVACGESKKNENGGLSIGQLAGTYTIDSDPSETMTIRADGSLTDTYCGYTASITDPDKNGYFMFTVHNTRGTPGCMSNTAHSCQLEKQGIYLGVSCDNDRYLYGFTKR